jgi:ectoine hydrolase
MEAAGIDVLFVTDPSNQAWLTGYDGWSFYVHQGVILGLNGDPIWWGRTMDAFGALRTVWMEERSVIGYDDRYIQSTTCHPMEDLAAHLTRLGYGKARVGVEMENYYYSAKAHAVLQKNLPNARPHHRKHRQSGHRTRTPRIAQERAGGRPAASRHLRGWRRLG